jgi:hypothetical protein
MKVVEAVEHMRKTHAGIAGGHRAAAAMHRTFSKCHDAAMQKTTKDDPQHAFHKSAKEAHDAAATDQDQRADYHDAMGEKCEQAKKIAGDQDLSKGSSDILRRLELIEGTIIPTKVSAVVPNAPGVTAVPRAGQRQVNGKANVPIAFEKMVAIETE